MPAPVSIMTQEQYIVDHRGGRCPVCHGNNIDAGGTNYDLRSMSQEITCGGCHAVWYDIYSLVSYELSDRNRVSIDPGPGHDEPDQ